jgi:hypothetical protein
LIVIEAVKIEREITGFKFEGDVWIVVGLIFWLHCNVFDTRYTCVVTVHAPYINLPPLYNQFH